MFAAPSKAALAGAANIVSSSQAHQTRLVDHASCCTSSAEQGESAAHRTFDGVHRVADAPPFHRCLLVGGSHGPRATGIATLQRGDGASNGARGYRPWSAFWGDKVSRRSSTVTSLDSESFSVFPHSGGLNGRKLWVSRVRSTRTGAQLIPAEFGEP